MLEHIYEEHMRLIPCLHTGTFIGPSRMIPVAKGTFLGIMAEIVCLL